MTPANLSYFLKMKKAGWSDDRIAAKMGMEKEDVEKEWQKIKAAFTAAASSNGYDSFCDVFTVMAHQYQLVGESMKQVAALLGGLMREDELRALIDQDVEKTLDNLKNKALVFRPYLPGPVKVPSDQEYSGN